MDAICDALAQQDECKSLRQACKLHGVAIGTFLGWCAANKEVADQYARADQIAVLVGLSDLEELADEPAPLTAEGKTDSGWCQWQRNRIDARKWAWSKRHPKSCGDKLAHTGPDGEGAVIIKVDM